MDIKRVKYIQIISKGVISMSNDIRKITHIEKLLIEDAISAFGTMELQGGSKETKEGKTIYHLCFNNVHLSTTSPEARKVGRLIKKRLKADEIWLLGTRIA